MSVEIPDGIEIIAEESFSGRIHPETIVIPESIKVIESKAFYGCSCFNWS